MVGLFAEGTGWPWIGGLRDPLNPDIWIWSDGTPWDYSNWAPGEPNDLGGEDCVEIGLRNISGWNDQSCSKPGLGLNGFVCKKGKNPGHCQTLYKPCHLYKSYH